MAKYKMLRDSVEGLPNLELVEAPCATDSELLMAHDPSYIQDVLHGTLSEAQQKEIGFPWSAKMVERSRRSAGATIAACKAALEEGIPLSSVWNGDTPKVYDDGIGRAYVVNNYGEQSMGDMSLLTAMEKSVNTIFVPLGMKAGLEKVVDVARRAGVPDSVEMIAAPSVSLGAASPHVIDLANAYATFAAQGVYAKPFIINEVQGPNKGILYQGRIQAQEVFRKDVMADLTYALSRVTTSGTAAVVGSRVARPTAGKTGTSNDNASAWFNGYTPEVAASVAFYRDDATQSLNGIGGLTSVTGGSFPARIWAEFVKGYLKNTPVQEFPAPAYIGGTEPINLINAIPQMDPALIPPSPSPTPKKKK